MHLPVIMATLCAEQLERFNHFSCGTKDQGIIKCLSDPKRRTASDLGFFILLRKTCLSQSDWSCRRICYKGQGISYGSYDSFSQLIGFTLVTGVYLRSEWRSLHDLCKRVRALAILWP